MAARLNKRVATRTREAIQTTQLIKRLLGHAVGNVEMSATQVRAAEILLKKTIPDLKSIDHTGEITHKTFDEAVMELLNGRSIVEPDDAGAESVTH